MKNKISILLIIVLCFCTGKIIASQEIISDIGFVKKYSIIKNQEIQTISLGLRSNLNIYYILLYKNEIISNGQLTEGINIIKIEPQKLGLIESGKKELLLKMKDNYSNLISLRITITVTDQDDQTLPVRKNKNGTYSLKMYYQNRLILSKTNTITREILDQQRNEKVKKKDPRFNTPPQLNSPEDAGLYYSKYAFSIYHIAALGIREVVKKIRTAQEENKRFKIFLTRKLNGKVLNPKTSPKSFKNINLTISYY